MKLKVIYKNIIKIINNNIHKEMENNREEEILGNVRFDENGLPILGETNIVGGEPGFYDKNQASVILKENILLKEKLVISDDCVIVGSMIDRAKKVETNLHLAFPVNLISLSLFDLVQSDFESVDKNKLCEMIFDKCINQNELKEKIIEAIENHYNQPKSV